MAKCNSVCAVTYQAAKLSVCCTPSKAACYESTHLNNQYKSAAHDALKDQQIANSRKKRKQ